MQRQQRGRQRGADQASASQRMAEPGLSGGCRTAARPAPVQRGQQQHGGHTDPQSHGDGTAHRMDRSPLVMDSARRRFCSIRSPSTKPRINGAIGTPALRNR